MIIKYTILYSFGYLFQKVKMEQYDILDNGGRPYTVTIQRYGEEPRIEFVVSVTINNDENPTPGPIFRPCKVFVGKSPETKMTGFSGGYGPQFDGNSILLRANEYEQKYTYIGSKIYQFEALYDIVEYVSPVGNSCVPYPYAIDSNGNYYLMLNYVIMRKEAVPRFRRAQQRQDFDVYRHFYKIADITPDCHWDKHGNEIIDHNFQYTKDKFGNYIKEGYSILSNEDDNSDEDEQKTTLHWEHDPSNFYRFEEIGYFNEYGSKIKFEYTDYVELMDHFALSRHLKKMNYVILHNSRDY